MSDPTFHVVWECDIWAETPEDAARKALEILRDPNSTALFFTVQDEQGEDHSIDLAETAETE